MSTGAEYSKEEHHSHSDVASARTTHISLAWAVDFATSSIKGSAKHTVQVGKDTRKFIVDAKQMTITSATVQGNSTAYEVSQPHPQFGSAVTIDLGDAGVAGQTVEVEIFYETHPDASATQWLEPALTAGKVHPYLFTQCQAIHARSLVPCQDAPGNKVTYDAVVSVPGWSTALMSAVLKQEQIVKDNRVFTYEQQVPIPTYLIALAVGELASRDISERCKVWAEPSMVEDVAFEFSQTEEFLKVAESLTSPYMWGRYDVLCMPPSFPYGGMENPCLTFVTPTLLAGDRSLADVVAHEISHSWTGNLITNHTWEHFWLNEGWTVWLERKIMAAIHKDDRHRDFAATIGWKHLQDDVNLFGVNNPLTSMVPQLQGVDPDDSFSGVPYEKGCNFLFYLERLVGSDKFDNFAQAYINNFKYSTITSGEFRDFFIDYFKDDADASAKIAQEVDWQKWFFTPGMPPYTPKFDQTFANAALELADRWVTVLDGREAFPAGVTEDDMRGWTTQQAIVFLERLINECENRNTNFPESALSSMDRLYSLTENRNSEISLRWQQLCLSSECTWIVPHVIRFVTSQGRMKFVRPLYRALFKSTVGKAQAVATFSQYHAFYHPIARKMVAVDMDVKLEDMAKQSTARTVGSVNMPSSNTPPPAPTKTIHTTPASTSNTAAWLVPALAAVAAVAGAAFYVVRNRK